MEEGRCPRYLNRALIGCIGVVPVFLEKLAHKSLDVVTGLLVIRIVELLNEYLAHRLFRILLGYDFLGHFLAV